MIFLSVGCGGEEDEWSGDETASNGETDIKVSLRADSKIFYFPKHPDSHFAYLDWCKDYGSNCGKEAAEEFCFLNGRHGLDHFGMVETPSYGKYNNIGSTKTIGSNQYCTGGGCDGFWFVRCAFEHDDFEPKYGNYRVDFCKTWAQDCGQKAADAYCFQKNSYTYAHQWAKENNVGPTKTSNGVVCNHSGCDSFKYILCTGATP